MENKVDIEGTEGNGDAIFFDASIVGNIVLLDKTGWDKLLQFLKDGGISVTLTPIKKIKTNGRKSSVGRASKADQVGSSQAR